MSSFQRKTIAVIIFLVAAFFGANITGGMFGKIGGLASFIVVLVSIFFMWLAIDIWKGEKKDEKKGDDTENRLMN